MFTEGAITEGVWETVKKKKHGSRLMQQTTAVCDGSAMAVSVVPSASGVVSRQKNGAETLSKGKNIVGTSQGVTTGKGAKHATFGPSSHGRIPPTTPAFR